GESSGPSHSPAPVALSDFFAENERTGVRIRPLMTWKPNVTVAAVVERDGRFLLVEEDTGHGRLFNQPAGHLDPGESLVEAVAREALEETAYSFTPAALLGVYQYHHAAADITYLRFAFTGAASPSP